MSKSALSGIGIGISGACGHRAPSLKKVCDAMECVSTVAVCDTNAADLDAAARRLGVSEKYLSYEEMLDQAGLDAVLITTPMEFHASQAIAALERGVHVFSEVTAAASIEQCKALVRAGNQSDAIYMLAENYTYLKPNVLVRELVGRGLFGEVYYAEGEYLHELKQYSERTFWRRKWQLGIEGITYGTHSLGPILQWMPGDRIACVTCAGSGHHYRDPRGDPYAQDTSVMLGRTAKGRLVKIRVDIISNRPHAMTNYQLQGTDGCYESGRGGPGDRGKIWFRELDACVEDETLDARVEDGTPDACVEDGTLDACVEDGTLDACVEDGTLDDSPRWYDLQQLLDSDQFSQQYLPRMWYDPPQAALESGHGGGDYFAIRDWVNAIQGAAPCPIGIHEAMDMTLPGLVSQQSVLEEGRWMPVPDSREW